MDGLVESGDEPGRNHSADAGQEPGRDDRCPLWAGGPLETCVDGVVACGIDVVSSIAEGSASDGVEDPVGRASTVDNDRTSPTEGVEGDRIGDVYVCDLDVGMRWMVDC